MLRNGSGAADEAALQECALWRSDEQLLRFSNYLLIPWAQPLLCAETARSLFPLELAVKGGLP